MLAQHAVDVDRARDLADAVLGEHDHVGASRLVELDQVATDRVDLPHVLQRRRRPRADPLQVVVEMRQIDQRQRGRVFDLHQLRGVGDPAGRGDRCARTPEVEERKRPELLLQSIAERGGMAVDVGQLAAVGRIHRARRHADVGRRIHVEPPEQVGAGERRILGARRLPDLRRLHQPVRLPPEAHFALGPLIPAVGHDAVQRRGDGRSGSRIARCRSRPGMPTRSGRASPIASTAARRGAPRRIRSAVRPTTFRTTVFRIHGLGEPESAAQVCSTQSYSRPIDSRRSILRPPGSTSQV